MVVDNKDSRHAVPFFAPSAASGPRYSFVSPRPLHPQEMGVMQVDQLRQKTAIGGDLNLLWDLGLRWRRRVSYTADQQKILGNYQSTRRFFVA